MLNGTLVIVYTKYAFEERGGSIVSAHVCVCRVCGVSVCMLVCVHVCVHMCEWPQFLTQFGMHLYTNGGDVH